MSEAAGRELSNTMSGALLATVRQEFGEAIVQRLLDEAGDARSPSEIEDSSAWSSYAATRRLYRAAIAITGDPGIPRRAGAEIFRRYSGSEVIAMLRGLGSPEPVMRLIAEMAGKQTTVSDLACRESTDRSAVVSARTRSGVDPDGAVCDYRAGVFGSIPTIFGLPTAEVHETECQRRGDAQCLYQIFWDPTPKQDQEQELAFLREQVAALTSRFEALELMASELALVGEIDDMLRTITARASVAVRAPRYLLAIRLPGDERPRVHCIGVDGSEVSRLADEVLADPPDDHAGARLVVDIAGATTHFGRLAALHHDGYRFVPEERRLLMAYAGHAAAALQTAAAWGEARRQVDTLGTLLDLSRALAEIRSTEEAAECLASTLPKVLDCEEASVWIWSRDDGLFRCGGHSSRTLERWSTRGESSRGRNVVPGGGLAERLTLTVQPLPFGTGTGAGAGAGAGAGGEDEDEGEDELELLGTLSGFEGGLVMPLVARNELFGAMVIATASPDLEQTTHLIADRLPGIAGLAATAFATAQLVERIRHQAHHDPLTGLPNLRALEETPLSRAGNADDQETAISGLLFVDLDHFKQVNDEFGHAVGDKLLIAIGQRLRQVVRSGDRVIRIGGDEFAVHFGRLRDAAEAEMVAARVLHALTTPFELDGRRLEISASIGAALSSGGTETIEQLLSRSDEAMYRAKSAGRATIRYAKAAADPVI